MSATRGEQGSGLIALNGQQLLGAPARAQKIVAGMRRSRRLSVGRCRKVDDERTLEALDRIRLDALRNGTRVTEADAWSMGPCRILRTRAEGYGWHLSISHPKRYPTWDELAEARYQLLPDEIMAIMVLPPSDQYVNAHPNTFHLHEEGRPNLLEALTRGPGGAR